MRITDYSVSINKANEKMPIEIRADKNKLYRYFIADRYKDELTLEQRKRLAAILIKDAKKVAEYLLS
jgi:hypothetical protein